MGLFLVKILIWANGKVKLKSLIIFFVVCNIIAFLWLIKFSTNILLLTFISVVLSSEELKIEPDVILPVFVKLFDVIVCPIILLGTVISSLKVHLPLKVLTPVDSIFFLKTILFVLSNVIVFLFIFI